MKKFIYISVLLIFFPWFLYGQDTIPPIVELERDSLSVSEYKEEVADTVLRNLSTMYTPVVSKIDTTKSINYWRITERTGEIVAGKPDTLLTDYFNRTNPDGQFISVAQMGNLGLPMESRIFFDREDRSHFMFFDPYYAYSKAPNRFNFINTKIPYSNVSYQRAGSRENLEERLQGILAINYGKKLNFGVDVDYLYARGLYNNQGSKHLEWVFFANYISDRHQLHLFVNPANYTNEENGGIEDDNDIKHPELQARKLKSKEIKTNLQETWNNQKGTRYYLNYHYNLGFNRDTKTLDEEGDTIFQFIPVSSIIYTFDYTDRKRSFYTKDSTSLANFYENQTNFMKRDSLDRDSTSYWSLRNTLALSMREGFSSWAKFDLTAFITQDVRTYTSMDSIRPTTIETNQYSTYVGGELAKRTGKILRYNAQGSFGIIGYNLADIDISGNIETRIPVLKDTASVIASGYIKNIEPTYYENHYHSKYFWWDEKFSKVKKVYFGGTLDIPHTKTNFTLGVENVTDYIYFDEKGYPRQHSGDIQILGAILKQNFKFRAVHWDNQLVYQTSSNQDVIPLPDFSVYSSLYLQFMVAKVLTIQMGGNINYFSKYYSPTYEPATQQFRVQKETKVGDYPIISGFINCHLKQTRFFVQFYNVGSKFIEPPNYFSMPHYPLNPFTFKMGLSVDFHN